MWKFAQNFYKKILIILGVTQRIASLPGYQQPAFPLPIPPGLTKYEVTGDAL